MRMSVTSAVELFQYMRNQPTAAYRDAHNRRRTTVWSLNYPKSKTVRVSKVTTITAAVAGWQQMIT